MQEQHMGPPEGPDGPVFDVGMVDEVLTTTRAVRRRLDLDRDVPEQVLWDCIDVAEQAPTGGDLASRRWLVLRDPAVKGGVAELYRAAGGDAIRALARRLEGTGNAREGVLASGAWLAEHLEQVPVLVMVTIWGEHDGRGTPGLFDSVLQAAWSFCLAARARGLGTAWTSMHLGRRREVAELLGIPDGVTQVVLLPVAWSVGTRFSRAPRRPASAITYLDRWGDTSEHPTTDGRHHLVNAPGVTVEVDVAARPRRVWELVSDITVPARFSDELQEVTWLDGAEEPVVGARFLGRSFLRQVGSWETVNHVVACDPPRRFAWDVVDIDDPGARWSFELEPLGADRTRLRHHMSIGPRASGTAQMILREPWREQEILGWRRHLLRRNMQQTVDGIKALAEGGEPSPGAA